MRQPSQGRSYYAIILHPLLNLSRVLNAPLVLSIFFSGLFVDIWFFSQRDAFRLKQAKEIQKVEIEKDDW